eukprot:5784069-Prymnesium_polylepis.1
MHRRSQSLDCCRRVYPQRLRGHRQLEVLRRVPRHYLEVGSRAELASRRSARWHRQGHFLSCCGAHAWCHRECGAAGRHLEIAKSLLGLDGAGLQRASYLTSRHLPRRPAQRLKGVTSRCGWAGRPSALG